MESSGRAEIIIILMLVTDRCSPWRFVDMSVKRDGGLALSGWSRVLWLGPFFGLAVSINASMVASGGASRTRTGCSSVSLSSILG